MPKADRNLLLLIGTLKVSCIRRAAVLLRLPSRQVLRYVSSMAWVLTSACLVGLAIFVLVFFEMLGVLAGGGLIVLGLLFSSCVSSGPSDARAKTSEAEQQEHLNREVRGRSVEVGRYFVGELKKILVSGRPQQAPPRAATARRAPTCAQTEGRRRRLTRAT